MGHTIDMTRASKDTKYADRVFFDSIQTRNVSVFDHATFEYATAPYTYSAFDTLTENIIDVWGTLDNAYRALMNLMRQWWDKGDLGRWQLTVETFLEVKDEFDMVEEWLTEGTED